MMAGRLIQRIDDINTAFSGRTTREDWAHATEIDKAIDAEITQIDAEAREDGKLIGRKFHTPRGDGCTTYVVVRKVSAKTVEVMPVLYFDAWVDPMIQSMDDRIPLKFAMERICPTPLGV